MSDKQFYILLGLGTFVAWSLVIAAKKAAAATAGAVDPTSKENVFYSGVNAIGDTQDDGLANDTFDFGGWLWDIAHPEWQHGIPENRQ